MRKYAISALIVVSVLPLRAIDSVLKIVTTPQTNRTYTLPLSHKDVAEIIVYLNERIEEQRKQIEFQQSYERGLLVSLQQQREDIDALKRKAGIR